MGLFDFLKKKPSSNNAPSQKEATPADPNSYVLETLMARLREMGFQADPHPQYMAIVVNSEIEIASVIIENPENHRLIMHLMVLTIHPVHFPKGIAENLVGLGETLGQKTDSVLDNYINTTFLPIIESFSDSHNPEVDFSTTTDGREILWHPKMSNLTLQGKWSQQPAENVLFDLVKDQLKNKMTGNKLNWLKLYICKHADGSIDGECLFNNEPWDEGMTALATYAQSWNMNGPFLGLKQFMMFRRCDRCDG